MPTVRFEPNFYNFLASLPSSIKQEVGINFYISEDNVIYNGSFIMGSDSTVLSLGYGVIKAHVHPYELYNGSTPYQPPTCTDLVQSIWDTLGGTQLNIVFETKGAWVYTIAPKFLQQLIQIDPSLEQYYMNPLTMNDLRSINRNHLSINTDLASVLRDIEAECVNWTRKFVFDKTINLSTYVSKIKNMFGKDTFYIRFVPYTRALSLTVDKSPIVNDQVLKQKLLSDHDIESFIYKMKGTYENNIIQ